AGTLSTTPTSPPACSSCGGGSQFRAERTRLSVICIVGMHRSGTSMITRLLNLCGVYLGPESDLLEAHPDGNAEGFWENTRFMRINEALLTQLAGSWDVPPLLPHDWQRRPDLEPLRTQARQLIATFDGQAIWGWKDPRTSLLLPFWADLIPDLQIVLCVRNPIEVAESLRKRNSFSTLLGLNLWRAYDVWPLAYADVAPIVTHYETCFFDPQSELRRVLDVLGIDASDETVTEACSFAKISLRHNRADAGALLSPDVPAAVRELYAQLCDQGGSVYERMIQELPVEASEARHASAANEAYNDAVRAIRFETISDRVLGSFAGALPLHQNTSMAEALARRFVDTLGWTDQSKAHTSQLYQQLQT